MNREPCIKAEPYRCELIPRLKFGGGRLDGSKTITLNHQPVTSAFFQQSSFATHAITLERAAVPVSADTAPEMLAALPCGIQTGAGAILITFKAGAGDSLVVFGAGTVGLSAVMAARLSGVAPIIAVDVVQSRLELALELGATHILNAGEGDVPARVKAIAPRGVRFAFESSATVQALENAIECLGQGGRAGIVSSPDGGRPFPFSPQGLFIRTASLQGIIQGSAIPRLFIPQLMELQRQGRFPYEKLTYVVLKRSKRQSSRNFRNISSMRWRFRTRSIVFRNWKALCPCQNQRKYREESEGGAERTTIGEEV
ncbi:MAG: zinc-binding dehydrogenase [Gammaproteobacteria bacterium]